MKKTASLYRATLETSLKPFKSMEPVHVEEVCKEMLRQWQPLISMAEHCSILLWTADGSEILMWNGDYDSEIEWARYIGLANEECFGITDPDDPMRAREYSENPVRITYRDLQRIVATFKRLAVEQGLQMQVGATFDPGPEFVYSDFKYKLHPEVNEAALGGNFVSLRPDYKVICSWSKLKEDHVPYTGFPNGIPEGTSFGRFLGRQSQHFFTDFGFDYIWFSNGFGFSYFPWTFLGSNFDGHQFNQVDFQEMSGNVMSFWDDFKKECPDFRTEVRGTNFSTGIDLAKDFVPLQELYAKKYLEFPPPNSPWGALNRDFGLEMVGLMSRIAELPGKTFPFRFYANDPWFWQNPWWDAYDREAYDIYCPLSIGRMNAEGSIENPGIVEILTIDTEKGELVEECPMEVIPHIARAIKDFPDQPGVLTWLYPFKEYFAEVAESQERASLVFFDEWFVRNAINQGLTLNTVVSTDSFTQIVNRNIPCLQETVLFASASLMTGERTKQLALFVRQGGKVLLYGPLSDPTLLGLLNLQQTVGIYGELELQTIMEEDVLKHPRSSLLKHDPLISGGPICEIVAQSTDEYTQIRAVVSQQAQTRVYALSRNLPEWNGGSIAWLRGTLAFETGSNSHLPIRHGMEYVDTSVLTRYLLADLGYVFLQTRYDDTTTFYPGTRYQEHAKPIYCFVSRHDNAYHFSGYKQDTTATIQFQFPYGAPLLIGQSALIENSRVTYSLDCAFHKECRVFVKQTQSGIVACKEGHPIRTRNKATNRSIVVTGLQAAEVTILPPLEILRSGTVEVNNEGRYIEFADHSAEGFIRLEDISGTIEITW
ncbi:hypothetical protein Back11_58980 [Paenibacillus baekrokdamisoli]|uniref:Uncharacterized protein n=1 Tax=Paenibacillus baekrokdamisoli TaxID=1712516 RepID=A0A3G9JHW8_9BACL|nr:hypothetical protein [Paenibacillus baekrokdamisoli]MBB3071414.1 hypothetical protein [Paenibacillus baekrokdamisoli]BBH24553.1 hypothetical protein Back11_58980 [Paenibacillus baekrokdamisoli]